jgi:hypothetical protein
MTARQGIALVALLVATVVGIVTAREWAIGRDAVLAADAAAAKSDWPEAITQARAAAEALAPGSPWPLRGWRRLEAVGHDAEARGDDPTALAAYSAMRTAAMETRAPGSGSDDWRSKAEQSLARVSGSQKTLGPHVSSESMLDALRTSETPSTARMTALSVASLAILGGLVWLVLSGDRAVGARVAKGVVAAAFVVYAVVVLSN